MCRIEKALKAALKSGIFCLLALIGLSGLDFSVQAAEKAGGSSRVVYPKKVDLDFEGLQIEGEVRNPGELYLQRKPEEKFDSLVKRRPNFHREMMRDALMSK